MLMKHKKLIYGGMVLVGICTGIFVLVGMYGTKHTVRTAEYSKGVPYNTYQNITFSFPDFDVVYTGNTENSVPNSTLKIVTHHFSVVNKTESKEVTWSSGLGVVAPQPFKMNGKTFELIMDQSGWKSGTFTITQVTTSGTNEKHYASINEKDLLGSWELSLVDPVHPCRLATKKELETPGYEAEFCEPNDSHEIMFSIVDGKKEFNTWLHHRPDIGDCVWSLDKNTVTLSCEDKSLSGNFPITSFSSTTMTIGTDGMTIPGVYKKIVE